MKMSKSVFTACAFLLIMLSNLNSQILLSDDFTGTTINTSKWDEFHDSDGGAMYQNDKIFWDHSPNYSTWTGHGLVTKQNFNNGGVYIIEGDYEITPSDVPFENKSVGERATGINIIPINPARDPNYYGHALRSIFVYLKGGVIYARSAYDAVNLTTKNEIWNSTNKYRHVFSYFNSPVVRIKIELDTDNRTIKCWGNDDPNTWTEATIPGDIWDEVLDGTNQFKIEEFRSWGHPISAYFENRLDNWSITRVLPETIVDLDIKPGSYPNPLNVKAKGVLPVAILGAPNFNVNDIDVSSILLNGVSPIRYSYEDVETSTDDFQNPCHTTTEGPEGNLDLTLKFDTQEIVSALGDYTDGEERVLTLAGFLRDGMAIKGDDCIVVIAKGKLNKSLVLDNYSAPQKQELFYNYPNPFNSHTNISFTLPESDYVNLTIYDRLGREIRTLVNEYKTAGSYSTTFDASNLASGIYYYRLKIGDHFQSTRKMMYLR
ncbi:T9SS type A sorting domain-containing protein [candidate division KSB1 bacterium]|nr:T9SS type A sorting domain-containing protein [candidate division KSB1 bacterium]